ncbi:MAG: o-succinylbenzoate synthase [Candidatus Dojkabacteria bacterium]
MVIEKIETFLVRLPLHKPFITGFGEINTKETVIVKISSKKNAGWGEASTLSAPIYNHESVHSVISFIKSHAAPLLTGRLISSPSELHTILKPFVGNNIAKAGLDFAVYDLFSRERNVSLAKLIGGNKKFIEVGGDSIGIEDDLNNILRKIEIQINSGRRRIKLKIKPGHDLLPLSKIREYFPRIDLMVDANGSYDYSLHKDVLCELDNYNLLMLEQPFPANAIYQHSLLAAEMKTPICLDESITDLTSAREAILSKACRIVNIKPGRVGGLTATVEINKYLQEHNIKCWCGGMLETSIGRAFNIAAASLANFDYPADISKYDHYFEDICKEEIFPIINSRIEVQHHFKPSLVKASKRFDKIVSR